MKTLDNESIDRLVDVFDEAIAAMTDDELRAEELERGEDSAAAFERAAEAALHGQASASGTLEVTKENTDSPDPAAAE